VVGKLGKSGRFWPVAASGGRISVHQVRLQSRLSATSRSISWCEIPENFCCFCSSFDAPSFLSPHAQHSVRETPFNMTGHVISESAGDDLEVQARKTSVEHVYDVNEKTVYSRAGAIEAENMEHNMGVLEAVRAYPSASWWALVMSCTIVSHPISHSLRSHSCQSGVTSLTIPRLWRPTAFFSWETLLLFLRSRTNTAF
jgi:hypothetical protein